MKSLQRIIKLAALFERKIAQEVSTSQSGTTELFFGTEDKQRAFASAIQDPKGSVCHFLIKRKLQFLLI